MLQIFALLCGICAWIFLICSIVREDLADRLRFLGWLFCAAALYVPSLGQLIELRTNDVAAVLDCVEGYHFASAVLFAVCGILSAVSFWRRRGHR